jgi:ribosomal protein L16 Arg81 hydroxylase
MPMRNSPNPPTLATLHPGDLIFTPEGWAHQSLNDGPTIAIAANFVDDVNFAAHARWLQVFSQIGEKYGYRLDMLQEQLQQLQGVDQTIPEHNATAVLLGTEEDLDFREWAKRFSSDEYEEADDDDAEAEGHEGLAIDL